MPSWLVYSPSVSNISDISRSGSSSTPDVGGVLTVEVVDRIRVALDGLNFPPLDLDVDVDILGGADDLLFFSRHVQQQAEQHPKKDLRRKMLCPACWRLGDITKEIGASPAEVMRHCRAIKYSNEEFHLALLEATQRAPNRRLPQKPAP